MRPNYWYALLIGMIIGSIWACDKKPAERSTPPPAPPPQQVATPPPPADPNVDAIKHDQALEQAAKSANDMVGLYKAQADEANHQAALAHEAQGQWEQYGKQAQANETAAYNAVVATKARWAGGILFAAALLGVIVAFWLPLARTWAVRFAVACSIGGSVCFAFAVAVPYLIWIGGAVIAGFILAMVYWWRKDHATLGAIVTGVENAKKLLPDVADDIHAAVSSALAGGALAHVEAVGKSIGVAVTKGASTVQADVKADVSKTASTLATDAQAAAAKAGVKWP
jgi:hypothetical protein